MATWCEELTYWKRPWCWERLKARGKGDDRRRDGWIHHRLNGNWVRASSGSWWWTWKPGMLQSMGVTKSQTRLSDWTIQTSVAITSCLPPKYIFCNTIIQFFLFVVFFFYLNINEVCSPLPLASFAQFLLETYPYCCVCMQFVHFQCCQIFHWVDITKTVHSSLNRHFQFSSVQLLSHVWFFATPWITARQASLSITNSQSSLKLTSIESVMPSSHLILCRPLFLLPPIPPSIRVFSNESTLRMRWPK